MQEDYSKFMEKKTTIIVVAPHDNDKVKKYFENKKFPFYGIPDPDNDMSQLYKQEWNLAKLGRMPALFIINTQGVIEFSYYSHNMADIPDNSLILSKL